ncbi:MAG: hypothetical protein ABIC19_03695 [Patescibacteria group bacterium]|nr:hypothetical protein [Patescibacteria group bacterium]
MNNNNPLRIIIIVACGVLAVVVFSGVCLFLFFPAFYRQYIANTHRTPVTERRVADGPDWVSGESDQIAAQQVLVEFFNLLHDRQYGAAAELFKPSSQDLEMMKSMAYESPGADLGLMLKNYCELMETCLPAKVTAAEKINENKYKLTVEFIEKNGQAYVLGPCCGATEEEVPPQSEFEYLVEKINGQLKVTTIPQYHP